MDAQDLAIQQPYLTDKNTFTTIFPLKESLVYEDKNKSLSQR